MEEIDLKDMFKYFLTKCYWIILFALIGLLFGFIYSTIIQVPMYKSYTTIVLTKENESITATDISLNKNIVDTYREIIKSKKIAKQVIVNLDLDYTANQLIKKVNVDSVNDTEMIKVTVVDEDSIQAKKIANEIAEIFNKEIVNYFNIQNVGVVDVADEDSVPYNVNVIKELVLSLLIGTILGFALVFVLYYFDTTIKSKEEVESKLELPVIGLIPNAGGTKK